MAIVCTCSSCGKHYAFEEKLAGKGVKCKNCAAVIAIPSAPVPLPSASKHDRPRSGDRFDRSAGTVEASRSSEVQRV